LWPQGGEINIDQAHRGYNMSSDGVGYRSVNPLFMKYTPTDGKFSGQRGYGEWARRDGRSSGYVYRYI
jgi:D-galacturonate reductase